ncbi:MAG TPA: hypothetical protein VHM90_13505 [Phycisphaerae bacterium]|jgi:hypothetical protein|nr:hypothetical protein [Phycisphaerae bacterium]
MKTTMKTTTFAMLLTAAALSAAPALGQGLLDNALDGKPAPAAAKPEAKPDTPAATADVKPKPAGDTPGGAAIDDPNAVKKVDEDELLAQLMKPGAKPDQQAIEQRLKNMVDRMGESATRLTQKDPGEVTQEVQRRIVADLDLMIELARQQQQGGGSSQKPDDQQQSGQKRTASQQQRGQHSEGGSTAAMDESLPRGSHEDAVMGEMRNHDPANWGGLPPRDRDQISHGANEEYLSSYKDMIDRYYQALAEIGKTKH